MKTFNELQSGKLYRVVDVGGANLERLDCPCFFCIFADKTVSQNTLLDRLEKAKVNSLIYEVFKDDAVILVLNGPEQRCAIHGRSVKILTITGECLLLPEFTSTNSRFEEMVPNPNDDG